MIYNSVWVTIILTMKHVISAICDQSLKLCGLSQFVSGSIDNLCSVQHVLCSSNNPLAEEKHTTKEIIPHMAPELTHSFITIEEKK